MFVRSSELLLFCFLFHLSVCAPHHDGTDHPHPHPDSRPFGFMNRIGRSGKDIASSGLWPNSNSHWADVPTTFGRSGSSNLWHQWTPSKLPASDDTFHAPIKSSTPFKRHVSPANGNPFGSVNSFSDVESDFDDAEEIVEISDSPDIDLNSFRPQSQGNSFRPPQSFEVPSYESFEPPEAYDERRRPHVEHGRQPPYESFDPQSYERPPPKHSKPSFPSSTSFQGGVQRPGAIHNAFPTGFKQFKESMAKEKPANFFGGSDPSSSGLQIEDTSYGKQPEFSTSGDVESPEEFFVEENEDFGSSDFTSSGYGKYPGSPFTQYNPQEGNVKIPSHPRPQHQPSKDYATPDPYSAPPSRPKRGPPEGVNVVKLGKNSHSYSTMGHNYKHEPASSMEEEFYSKPQLTRNPYQHEPYHQQQPQRQFQYGDIKEMGDDIVENEYQEFNDRYEHYDRGIDTDEKYKKNNGGKQKKHHYTQVNYREPIQRVYDKPNPEEEVEEYGTNYGAIEAYKGGFSSEKYDPAQYARDEKNNPDPGEGSYDGMEFENEEDSYFMRPEKNEGKDPRERRFGTQPQYMEEEEKRDPDDNEEGYYVPIEARSDEDEEEPEEEDEEMVRKEEEKKMSYPRMNHERPQRRKYRPRSQRRPSERKNKQMDYKSLPYYNIVKEVEDEVSRNTGNLLKQKKKYSNNNSMRKPQYPRYS